MDFAHFKTAMQFRRWPRAQSLARTLLYRRLAAKAMAELARRNYDHFPRRYQQSPAERRVDFAAIKRVMDEDVTRVDLALREPIRKVLDDLIELIKRQDKSGGITDSFVMGLTLTTGPEAQKILGDYLLRVWKRGRELAVDELPEKLHGKIRKFAGLEPVQAINFFQNLRPWLVKGIIDDDLKKAARLELTEHLKGGRTLTETIGNLRSAWEPWIGDPTKVIPSGISGTAADILQARRLENIVRTEAITALSQGRAEIADEAGDFVVGYQLSPIIDPRNSEVCARIGELEEQGRPVQYRKDDPRAEKLTPALHWQALPEGTKILVYDRSDGISKPASWVPIESVRVGQRVLTHKKRWRRITETMRHDTWPEEIVIHFADRQLITTDDHPILTGRGWVMAKDLTTNDSVICIASPCASCGKWTRGRYCSYPCAYRGKSKKRLCVKCGQEIRARFYGGKNGRKPRLYCSNDCKFQNMRKLVGYRCQNCRKEMIGSWKTPMKRGRRFCSFHCYHTFKGETTIEKAVRLWLDEQGIRYTQHKQFGRYTVDFYVHGLHLAIEVDGEYWHGIGGKKPHIQQRRNRYLEKQAIIIIRIPERAIKSGRFSNIILKAVSKHGKANSLFATDQDNKDRATALQ